MQLKESFPNNGFSRHKRKERRAYKITLITVGVASLIVLGLVLPNFLPFFIGIPFFIAFYYLKLQNIGTYRLQTLQTRNDVLLVSDKRGKNYLALTILQIRTLPQNLRVMEKRIRKKRVEKLVNPSDMQYLCEHLTLLSEHIPSLIYEVRVLNNEVRPRILLTIKDDNLERAIDKVREIKRVVKSTLTETFPGLVLESPKGPTLQRVWGEIFKEYGNYECKLVHDGVEIDRKVNKIHIALLKIISSPIIDISSNQTQLDHFIGKLLGEGIDLSYIVSMEPERTLEFRGSDATFFVDEKIGLSQADIQKYLQYIRINEITAVWRTSAYIVVRSLNESKLKSDINRIKKIMSLVFGVGCEIITGSRLKWEFPRIPMRSLLSNPMKLTSERVSIFIHFPIKEGPTISRSSIPTFGIPPEGATLKGIPVGRILLDDKEKYIFHLSPEALRLHLFVTGDEGVGKTRFVLNFLDGVIGQNPKINFLSIDQKGELAYLSERYPTKVMEYKPESEEAPLNVNLFDPQGMNADYYARKLTAILKNTVPDIFENPQINTVCQKAIVQTIKDVKHRSIIRFIYELKESMISHKNDFFAVNSLVKLFEELRGTSLDAEKTSVNFSQFLKQKSILNLELLSSRRNSTVTKLFMNYVITHILNLATKSSPTDSLKYLLVLEDCDLVAPSVFRETPESIYVDIPPLLRGVGVALIMSTSNSSMLSHFGYIFGTFVIFKTTPSPKISGVLNLNEMQERYLAILPLREAVVRLPNFSESFRIHTDYFEPKRPISNFSQSDMINSTLPKSKGGEALADDSSDGNVFDSPQKEIEKIKARLDESFVRTGLIGKIPSDFFDYVSYRRKCLVKIYQPNEEDEEVTLQEKMTLWCEEAHKLDYPEIVLILPSSYRQVKLKSVVPEDCKVHVFSTSEMDWNNILNLLNSKGER